LIEVADGQVIRYGPDDGMPMHQALDTDLLSIGRIAGAASGMRVGPLPRLLNVASAE